MTWLIEPFEHAFMRQAFAASLLISLCCSLLGPHVVLRRMAFLGDALAHAALPGLVAAWMLGTSLFGGALAAGLITASGISWLGHRRLLREDTAIGVLHSGMLALGVLLISATSSFRDFSRMLFGNVFGISKMELTGIAAVALLIALLLRLFRKELLLTALDPAHAQVIGLSPGRIRTLLLFMLTLTVVTAIQAVGVVLTTALLVTPSASAVVVGAPLRSMWKIAFAISAGSSIIGLYASWHFDVSGGSAIVVCCSCCFAVMLAWQQFGRKKSRIPRRIREAGGDSSDTFR
ncbi:MAG: metal ABC transporter permease [Planctomycetaceae bacterium]